MQKIHLRYAQQELFQNDSKSFISVKTSYNKMNKIQIDKTIGLYCFNPAIAFNLIASNKPYSMILTSGTIYPLDSLEN